MPAKAMRFEILEPDGVTRRCPSVELSWWGTGGWSSDPRFVATQDNGYLDQVALLSQSEFRAINDQADAGLTDSSPEGYARTVRWVEEVATDSEHADAVFKVVCFEWESGLD